MGCRTEAVSICECPVPTDQVWESHCLRTAIFMGLESIKGVGSGAVETWIQISALPLAHRMNCNKLGDLTLDTSTSKRGF